VCCAIYIPLAATFTIRALPISIDERVDTAKDITFDEPIITSLFTQTTSTPDNTTTRPTSRTKPLPDRRPIQVGLGTISALAQVSSTAVLCYGLHLLSNP
jgi:hypothetical protein